MKYYIRYEILGGYWYYMIYRKRWFWGDVFIQRCNTSDVAVDRLNQLNGTNFKNNADY